MVSFENVSKIYAENLDLARSYALGGMLGRPRRSWSSLRPGEFFALRDLSFRIGASERLLLLGTPGSGKSTVARLLAGLLRPDEGRVRVDGRVRLISDGKLGSNAFMTVEESLELALSLVGVPPERNAEARARVLATCAMESLAGAHLADVPRDYQRLLLLAASLAGEGDVFVFDGRYVVGEGPVRQRLLEQVTEIMSTKTVLVTATAPPVLPVAAQHALVLHEGQPLYYGEPAAILPLYDRFLEALRRVSARRDRFARRAVLNPGFSPSPTLTEAETAKVDAATAVHVLRSGRRFQTGVMSPLVFEEHLARIKDNGRPVVVGPWLSNTALELLYWVPFLAWIKAQLPDDQPVIAVSRGGADLWYEHTCSSYLDLYDVFAPEDFRARNERRVQQVGSQKQLYLSEFESEILSGVSARLGVPDVEVVHPSLVYRMWTEIWRGRLPASFASHLARYARLTPPSPGPAVPDLPRDYVAVKFEYNALFEAGEVERALVTRLVQALARRVPVVVLNTGHDLDNYQEGAVALGDNVFGVPRPEPRRSLDLQTRVLAGARAFVGTYGGISYLAPYCGVDAFTLYSNAVGFFGSHNAVLGTALAALGERTYVIAQTARVNTDQVAEWAANPARQGRRSWFRRSGAPGLRFAS
jgi:lipopolysaccharide transport system ATP-binding protein